MEVAQVVCGELQFDAISALQLVAPARKGALMRVLVVLSKQHRNPIPRRKPKAARLQEGNPARPFIDCCDCEGITSCPHWRSWPSKQEELEGLARGRKP